MIDDDRDLERLLRSTLDDEVRRHGEPAGDGLARIRERAQKRRRWSGWMKPTLALAGAAAVGAALVAAPQYLTGSRDKPGLVAGALDHPAELSPSVSPSGTTLTPSSSWGPPIGGDQTLPDRIAIWPYPSRKIGHEKADADVASGRYPDLADAGQTAVDFVASFVGGRDRLSATRIGPAGGGVAMQVQRKDGNGEVLPVSNVFLLRVRAADDSPYVVLGASRAGMGDTLTLASPPRLNGTATVTVTGTVRSTTPDPSPGPGAIPTSKTIIRVSLREPGSSEDLGLGGTTAAPTAGTVQTWSVDLSPFRKLTGSGVVAAWTTDEKGSVAEFVAAPISQ
jgi:hypothetical protein